VVKYWSNTIEHKQLKNIKILFSIVQRIGIIIGMIIIAFQIRKAVLKMDLSILALPSIPLILLALLFAVFAIFFQINAWRFVMKSINIHISLKAALSGYVLSFIPKYIPGTIWGYLSRSEWLYRMYQLDFRQTILGSGLEVVQIFLSSLFIISIYFSITTNILFLLLPFLFFLSWILILKVIDIINNRRNLVWLSYDLISRKTVSNWIKSIFNGILMWTMNGVALHILFSGYLDSTCIRTIYGMGQATFAFTVAWIIGFIALIIPSGIGIRELVLAFFLTYSLNLDPGVSSFISVFFRVLILLAEVLFIVLSLLLGKRALRFINSYFHKD